jgi:hypothetical protein
MEPVIRSSNLFSFDISAIQHSHAPANRLTPNGFSGEEACTLMQFAGMSMNVNTIGIYGYLPQQDEHNLTAKQISHMLWYLMDGVYKGKMKRIWKTGITSMSSDGFCRNGNYVFAKQKNWQVVDGDS